MAEGWLCVANDDNAEKLAEKLSCAASAVITMTFPGGIPANRRIHRQKSSQILAFKASEQKR